jgi:hypothetical protein
MRNGYPAGTAIAAPSCSCEQKWPGKAFLVRHHDPVAIMRGAFIDVEALDPIVHGDGFSGHRIWIGDLPGMIAGRARSVRTRQVPTPLPEYDIAGQCALACDAPIHMLA